MNARAIALLLTVSTIFSLIVVGAYVTSAGYGDACGTDVPRDWPTCRGGLVPPLEWGPVVEYLHRLLAALSTLFLVITTALFWRGTGSDRFVRTLLTLALVILFAQVLVGGVVVAANLSAVLVTLHQALAVVIFGLVVAALTISRRPS